MVNSYKFSFPALALAAVLLLGCSVKENREDCPCRLELDFREVDTLSIRSADMMVTSSGGFSFNDILGTDDFRAGVVLDVPREKVTVGVWNGTGGLLGEDGVHIPPGGDCPRLYFHAASLDAVAEELIHETVYMRKNHCVMKISLKGMEPSDIRIVGNVDGYMPDGKPSEGVFSYRISALENIVVLPRQLDNSLSMEVNDGSGVLKRFAVGEYISECGYDWDEPDLRDLEMEIDVAVTHISLHVQGRDKEYKFEISI